MLPDQFGTYLTSRSFRASLPYFAFGLPPPASCLPLPASRPNRHLLAHHVPHWNPSIPALESRPQLGSRLRHQPIIRRQNSDPPAVLRSQCCSQRCVEISEVTA